MREYYYYMFSSGQYSDYCVGGMFKSKEELSEEYFTNHLKNMILEQVSTWPEAVEYINSLPVDISALSQYGLQQKLFALEAGEAPKSYWADGQNRWNKWYEAYTAWEEKVGKLDRDFIQDLVNKGVLEQVEYTEIWNGA